MCYAPSTENALFHPHNLHIRNVFLLFFCLLFVFFNEGTEVSRNYATCLWLLELVSDGIGAQTEISNLTKPLSVISLASIYSYSVAVFSFGGFLCWTKICTTLNPHVR